MKFIQSVKLGHENLDTGLYMEIKLVAGNPEKAKRHIIFIHGLKGHITETWMSNMTYHRNRWPTSWAYGVPSGGTLWPQWLNTDLPDTAVWLLGYPAPITNWFSYAPHLSELSDNILARLCINDKFKRGEIFFVAHSFGGLVVKQTLLSAQRDSKSDKRAASLLIRTKGVTFMGTPHRGSFLANILAKIPVLLRGSNVLTTLKVGNDQVQSIYSNYKTLSRDQKIRHLPLCEGRPRRIFGLNLPFKIVSNSSADPGVEENPQALLDEDHNSISKPKHQDSDAYLFLLDFLNRNQPTRILPPGFTTPESLPGEDGGLRSRLSSSEQAYVPAETGARIDSLLQYLENHNRPLVITGEGGLGKTRLALELYHASGYQGILIQKNASADGVSLLINDAKNKNQKILFLIDYIEEMSSLFDSIYQTITREGEGHAYLITTTRSVDESYTKSGPEYLNETSCHEISLNQPKLIPWRKQVCTSILTQSGIPEYHITQNSDLDVPAIASLIAYDFQYNGLVENETIRKGDASWLIKRLRRNSSKKLSDEDFILLLSLYPFEDSLREKLSPEMLEAADDLHKHGWVSTLRSSNECEWRLGHDLLSDIPLVFLLLSNNKPLLRYKIIERLGENAKKINVNDRFARALTRALNKLIGGTLAKEILETLQACIDPLSAASPHPFLAVKTAKKALCSLSLNLNEKLRIFTELISLNHFQLTALITTFKEEVVRFKKLNKDHPDDIQKLITQSALGSSFYQGKLTDIYNTKLVPQKNELIFSEISGAFIPQFYTRGLNRKKDNEHKNSEFNKKYSSVTNTLNQADSNFSLSHMPSSSEIFDLSPDSRAWIGNAMLRLQGNLRKDKNTRVSISNIIIERFIEDDHPPVREIVAKSAVNKAQSIAERDNTPSSYDWVIKHFINDDYQPVRIIVAQAALNKAIHMSKRDQTPSSYDWIIEQFINDDHQPVRKIVAQAAFNRANDIANRDNDPSSYDWMIEQFINDDHQPVRKIVAQAAFNRANDIANRDNDPSSYDSVIEQFSNDDHKPIRETAARAALNKAHRLAERDYNLSFFDSVIEQFSDHEKTVNSAKSAKVAWLIVFDRVEEAIPYGEALLSTISDLGNLAVISFLIWLAEPTMQHRSRVEEYVTSLDGKRTGWTFDEFIPKITSLSKEDRVFAKSTISLIESKN